MITPGQFLGNLKTAPLADGVRYDNEMLAEWNRNQAHCAICGEQSTGKLENSHTIKKGRGGVIASQIYALGICHSCHMEYEATAIEIYLQNHPNLFEIVTRNIEKQFDFFTGIEKTEKRVTKIQQKKKTNSIFKKVKNNRDGLEKCGYCGLKSFPKDTDRHFTSCKFIERAFE